MTPKHYQDIVYKIIGAAMEVHSVLKWGLLEPVYNEALCMELKDRGIECGREIEIPCYYKNHKLEKKYRMDIVAGDIVIELKSVSEICPEHRAQIMNYLRLTKMPIGILINFGTTHLEGERYYYNHVTNSCYLIDKNMEIVEEDD